MRAINAVRELNEERDEPIRVIALYTETERYALFVRQADERHCLGPAMVDDGAGGRRSAYLDYDRLERALIETQADAAWVGWGFVAEHPAFAELCDRLGIVFAGPDADVMRKLGDKIEAKKLAEQAGVPVAPWSGGPVETAAAALEHGAAIGYPLMIKAAAGGGGRGMRRVDGPDELAGAIERARAEAAQAFGDPSVLIERIVEAARHVEVQLMADGHGCVWALGVRDCSYQRRHQKVVEESASPALTPAQEAELSAAAVRLAESVGYRGAGTVEFLYEPAAQRFAFMEVNTRLQVEHPVTEAVTGADLVKLQLHVAAGGRLEGEPPPPRGHAIEVRLNAEDPGMGFAPAPGRIALLRLPAGPGHPRRQRRGRGRHRAARVRLDDRQDHRPRPHAPRGDRPAAPRRGRHDGRDRGGRDQPGLPARAAGPVRAAPGRGRHGLARPPADPGRRAAVASCRHRADSGGDRARRRRHRRRPGAPVRARPPRSPAGRGRALPRVRPAPPRLELPPDRVPGRARPLPGRGRRRGDRGGGRAADGARAPALLRRHVLPHRDRAARDRRRRRGQRRPAPDRARRGRSGPQPRARRGRGHHRRRGRRGRRRRRGRRDRVDEDGDLPDRAGRGPRPPGARVRQRPGRAGAAAARDRGARGRAGRERRRARDVRRRGAAR